MRTHTFAQQQAPQILESNYSLHFVYYLLREARDRVCVCVWLSVCVSVCDFDKISPVILLSYPVLAPLFVLFSTPPLKKPSNKLRETNEKRCVCV